MSKAPAVNKGRPQPAGQAKPTGQPRPPVAASAGGRGGAGGGGGDGDGRAPMRHADEAVASMLARDAYTRERHLLMTRVIAGQAAAIVVALAAVFILATRPVEKHYFLTDNEGRIREIRALSEPVNTLPEVTTWVTNAITASYTFSFANYQQELSAARANFTPAGWGGFEKALKDSGNLKSVVENKYVATAVPTGAAILLTQGTIEGRFAYKFQVPILVTYQSAVQRTTQNLMVTAIVVRQPETDHPRGLGIASLIAE